MSEEDFMRRWINPPWYDMTVPFSVMTPQWLNYIPLSVTYTKRVGGQYLWHGPQRLDLQRHLFIWRTHMDGEKHFYPNGRVHRSGAVEDWVGPGVIADISGLVSDSSVYTPKMIHDVVDIQKGDILIIKTGWNKFGWRSADSDEFRYMVKHPGPSPDFSKWARICKSSGSAWTRLARTIL